MRKSHAAGWASDAPRPAQLQELFAQIEKGSITRPKLRVLLRGGIGFKKEEAARTILGKDIVFPDEVAEAREGIYYDDAVIRFLVGGMPSDEALLRCKEDHCVVMPGPPTAMGVLGIRSLNPQIFSSRPGTSWYDDCPFSYCDLVKPGWLAIRREPVPGFVGKNEDVPNAAEMAWAISTYFEVRGVRLLERRWARTSSTGRNSKSVSIGNFDTSHNLCLGDWIKETDPSVGLAACRKFSSTSPGDNPE